jgi:hypothetical protein
MQQNNRNVPDWLLERLALGELDAETAADVRRRLAAEGRSPDDIAAAVAASNREILAELPATQAAAEIRQRVAKAAAAAQPARRRGIFLMGVPLALAGGLALTQMMWRPAHPNEGAVSRVGESPEIITVKGADLKVYVYRRGATGPELLSDGARAARGDLLQLAYASKTAGYGVLLSIDGAGKVTLHLPEAEGGRAAPLREGGATVRIPAAYQLDGAPAFERFFLVRAATPFSVATAVEAARALAAQPTARKQALALPPGFEQISLSLDKTHGAKKELP